MQYLLCLLFLMNLKFAFASGEPPYTYEVIKKITNMNINKAVEEFLEIKIIKCQTWDNKKVFTWSTDLGECLYTAYRSKLRDALYKAVIEIYIQKDPISPQKIELIWNPGLDSRSEFLKWLKNLNELKNEYLSCKNKSTWTQDHEDLFYKYQSSIKQKQDSNILNDIEIRFSSPLEVQSLLSKYFILSQIHNAQNMKYIRAHFVTDSKNYTNSIIHSEIVFEEDHILKKLEFYWQLSVNLFCHRNRVSFESPP